MKRIVHQLCMLLVEIFNHQDFLDRPLESRLLACSNAIERMA